MPSPDGALPKPRVAITGHSFPDLDIEREVLGHRLSIADTGARDGAELAETLDRAVAVINQSADLTSAVIAGLTDCRVIVEYGIGVDRIDVEAATRKGIQVCNVPDYCIEEVSTHALALVLSFERQVPQMMQALKAGSWEPPSSRSVRRFAGRRLGLVGMGRIARRFCELARPLGVGIAAFDPHKNPEAFGAAGIEPMSLDELLSTSDYISIHCPLTPQTRGLIGADQLAAMKPDAVLINVSRGKVVQERALIDALRSGTIRGAALDVFEDEPLDATSPLLALPNVVVSPHIAWLSLEAEQQLKREAAEEVLRVLSGKAPKSPVNKLNPHT